MLDRKDYGVLVTPNIKLHRMYFNEMVKLIGVQCIYRAPLRDKHYTLHTELKSTYAPDCTVGCIFDEHPNQQTLRKAGWVAELQQNASIISVPYDLQDLQQGALFEIPSALEGAAPRLFRVVKLSTIMIYPASIACEIVPEYADTLPSSKMDVSQQDFNLLAQEN